MQTRVLAAIYLSATSWAAATPYHYFATTGPGITNPGVLVGFNPQPDPPGSDARLDLTNPYHPVLTQDGSGEFTVVFGLRGNSGSPTSFALPLDDPDIAGRYQFLASVDGQEFRVTFDIGGYLGGWSGFNPQPDPPGYELNFVGFSFQGDPSLSILLESGSSGPGGFTSTGTYSFSEEAGVPEPGTWLLATLGLACGVGRLRPHIPPCERKTGTVYRFPFFKLLTKRACKSQTGTP